MPSWCNYRSITLVLGTILRTIDFVYLQLPGGNPPLAELNASQSEPRRIESILGHLLGVYFPPLGVGSHVGWLHSWDNVRTTQFAPRCTRSERYKWCVMPKQCLASQTVITASTKSRLEAPYP